MRVTQVLTGVALLGILVHGPQASRLGLYWDDAYGYLQPLQAAGGDTVQFVFTDTFDYLKKERPLAYFFLIIHRAAFAWGLPFLHWSQIALLILNASLLAMIVRRIAGQEWLAFAAGAIYLTYPLSPLQSIWPATAHYLWSSFLALLAIQCILAGLNSGKGRHWWMAGAVTAYVGSLLTLEGFALLPPAVAASFLIRRRPSAADQTRPPISSVFDFQIFGPALRTELWLLMALACYGIWRTQILPLYGNSLYSSSEAAVVGSLTERLTAATSVMLMSGVRGLWETSQFPPPQFYFVLALVLAAGVCVFNLLLVRRTDSSRGRRTPADSKSGFSAGLSQATATGMMLAVAGLATLAIAPLPIERAFGVRNLSRINFIAAAGVAFLWPVLMALLLRLWRRAPRCASLMILSALIYFGFFGFPAEGNIVSHRSTDPALLGRYSAAYACLLAGYAAGLILALWGFVRGAGFERTETAGHEFQEKTGIWSGFSIPGLCLSAAIASLVFLGSLFQFSQKALYIREWDRQKVLLKQLRQVAPALQDDTFVVLVYRPPRAGDLSYSKDKEWGSYLLAIYDNWSVTGNTDRHLAFFADGVESRRHFTGPERRLISTWFPPGVKGPLKTAALRPLPRISYNRLLLFEFDGARVRMLPEMTVESEQGQPLVVRSHADRILDQPPAETQVWRHVVPINDQRSNDQKR